MSGPRCQDLHKHRSTNEYIIHDDIQLSESLRYVAKQVLYDCFEGRVGWNNHLEDPKVAECDVGPDGVKYDGESVGFLSK
jgi:hypothetical protein